MNYLAHLYLTYPDIPMSLGNLIGDMVRPRDLHLLDDSVRYGVMAHRAIDWYVDRHDAMRALTTQLRPAHRKYAPVVLDIVMDYILCTQWNEWPRNVALPDFLTWANQVIEASLLPDTSLRVPEYVEYRLTLIRNRGWLRSYQTLDGLRGILRGMDGRSRFPSNFIQGAEDVVTFRDEMTEAMKLVLIDTSDHLASVQDRLSLEVERYGKRP